MTFSETACAVVGFHVLALAFGFWVSGMLYLPVGVLTVAWL